MPTRLNVLLVSYRQWHSRIPQLFACHMICLQNVDAWPYHSLPFLQELKRQAPGKICNSKAERAATTCNKCVPV